MTAGDLALFALAGLLGGAVNALAGGAKLFVFPMLLASGLPPIVANATATIALWPAQAPAAWAYRRRLGRDARALAGRLLPALAGAVCGALALIVSSEAAFVAIVPFFLVAAVVTVALGNRVGMLAARYLPRRRMAAVSGVLMFVAGFYGGYFGAGLGFLLVAALLAAGLPGIQDANAEKNLLAFLINTAAAVPLLLSGLVDGVAAAGVIVGGVAGGYLGARFAQLLPELTMRIVIAGLGFVLTMAFLFG